MSKTILVTGGAGFIGSNFVPYFAAKYPEYHIINLDKLTYAGNLDNLAECADMPNYTFVHGDICNRELIEQLFTEHDIRGVIHFAAESHVDNSIKNPDAFIKTNINGTFNLIDVAFRHWHTGPGTVKPGYEDARFHHISTDEVYGTLGADGMFTETTPYAPNSPYSASKASSDFIVRAYHHTFGMNVTTSNCSNNYGPRQHSEKLIPHIIDMALTDQPLPIYGRGENIRDWLYVLDHARAIDLIFHRGRAGETYNIGGRNERNNITIVKTICRILDERKPRGDGRSYADQITFVADRAGHDFRYAIDATKLEQELGWRADETFDTGIIKTVEWYLNK
ncbi:MAG: dTDP-glucose 4,6-dehydratase [Alphaproteobacteria bacterium]|nr:dTDP-glucose 4,6-dehydratase [Alphaproteobacteria bacterium]MDE6571216.1 dTDP-glucose 4,6-dehydratase [Alphaproteobacteria bacterium]